jgi:Cyclic nucleotide-binding domain
VNLFFVEKPQRLFERAMDNFFDPVDLPAHLSYIVIAISYFLTNIFWLRVTAVAGLFLEIVYFKLTGTNARLDMPWDLAFITINLYQLIWLVRERINATLPEKEAAMLRQSFEGLSDAQIARLLKAADWQDYLPGDILTRQDAPVDALYFLCTGRANVEINGSLVTYLEKGSFVGEIAYLTGNPATARVTIDEPSRVLAFSKMRMAKVMAKDNQISGILYQLLGRDLAQKMRRANTRKVFTDDGLRL